MKKIKLFINLMCVFALGFTQANAEKLRSYMPEKTGIENYTVDEFISFWSNKSDNEFMAYIGSHLLWSAENAKIAPTENVYSRMVKLKYGYAFGDATTMRSWLSYMYRDAKPLEGQVNTAGINAKGKSIDFEREAYFYELPFMIDWNFLENPELSDPSAPIHFDADIAPVKVFSAKCANPIKPSSVGGGYTPLSQSTQRISEFAPGDTYEQKEVQTSGGGTTVINNYYNNQPVSFEESESGYVDDRAKWYFSFGLNLNIGPQYANTHCGGYGGGYGYGYAGNSYGQCSHGYPYQQFAYQPSGGGNPQNINIEVINQITNTATATAANTIGDVGNGNGNGNNNGNGNGNGNPPGPSGGGGDPIEPPTGDGIPIEPPTGKQGKRMTPQLDPYQNNVASAQTKPDSRPVNSQSPSPKPGQVTTATSSGAMTPRENHGNEAMAFNKPKNNPDSRPATVPSADPRTQPRTETIADNSTRTGSDGNGVRTNPGNYVKQNSSQDKNQSLGYGQARPNEIKQSQPQQTKPDSRQQRGYGNQGQQRQQIAPNQAPPQGNSGGFQQGRSQGGSRSGGRR